MNDTDTQLAKNEKPNDRQCHSTGYFAGILEERNSKKKLPKKSNAAEASHLSRIDT